jgi:hypothetical protein
MEKIEVTGSNIKSVPADALDVTAVESIARLLLVKDDERLAELIAEYLGRNGMLPGPSRGAAMLRKGYKLK